MKRIIIGLCIVSLCSCIREDVYNAAGQEAVTQQKKEITASCAVTSVRSVNNDSRGIPSRGIIGQETVEQLDANFIKLDETIVEGVTSTTYVPTKHDTWYSQQTKLVNASVFSSPDNTQDIHFRSVTFSPKQTYQIQVIENPGQEKETVGYISRMVGWYPRTEEVLVDEEGVAADVSFIETDSYKQVTADDGTTYDCVVFKNKLDGETDVMMTDMREGRYDLSSKGFKNNENDRDIQPYGHMMNGNSYTYCNYFSFKHYLTAVRLYIKVDNSDLSLVSWRHINDIVFLNQPQTVTIALPKEQSRGGNDSGTPLVGGTTPTLPVEGVEPVFGEPLVWEDETNMPIIKTAMAENDPSYPEFAEVPSYPLTVDNTVSLEKTYMGYILLQPDKDTDFEIHTDAGVYRGTIPATFGEQQERILEAGYIYNIVVDMKADGSLDMVVGNEDSKSYRNLTPYNNSISDFEYSNCFVVSQELMKKSDSEWYDGFYFQAMVPGCGERGSIIGTGADLYPKNMFFTPHSARILWQDVPYLVTHVELVHGYVRFTLNDKCKTDGLQGNAVLAALDENGDIIWSWHVWVNNGLKDITYASLSFLDPENSAEYGDNPSTTTSRTLTDVGILNMNLGATKASWSTGEDPLACYGLYYQWGRKDPSPLPPSYDYGQSDMTTKPYYYMDEGEKSSVYRHLELYPTVETGALNPLDIIATAQIGETYPNDWLYTSVDQLWGYSPSAKEVVKKTIYDPCPYGYRIADDELFALFYSAYKDNSYEQVDGKGIKVTVGNQDNYFPFSGWRGHDRSRTDKTNAWYNVGNLGDYQDARVCKNSTTYKNHRGRSFLIRSNLFVNGEYKVQDVSPAYKQALTNDYANRSSASPVRCVRYQEVGEEPLSTDTGN